MAGLPAYPTNLQAIIPISVVRQMSPAAGAFAADSSAQWFDDQYFATAESGCGEPRLAISFQQLTINNLPATIPTITFALYGPTPPDP